MYQKFRFQFSIAFVCLILGFSVSVQLKSVYKKKNEVKNIEKLRAEELQIVLIEEKEKNDALRTKIKDYENKISSEAVGIDNDILKKKVEDLGISAGLTNLKGQGIVLTIKEPLQPILKKKDGGFFNINTSDILQIVNELNFGGAEATAINGFRLSSTTNLEYINGILRVDVQNVYPPFELISIGDPKNLRKVLLSKNSRVNVLNDLLGVEFDIKESSEVLVPAIKFPKDISYSKPQN